MSSALPSSDSVSGAKSHCRSPSRSSCVIARVCGADGAKRRRERSQAGKRRRRQARAGRREGRGAGKLIRGTDLVRGTPRQRRLSRVERCARRRVRREQQHERSGQPEVGETQGDFDGKQAAEGMAEKRKRDTSIDRRTERFNDLVAERLQLRHLWLGVTCATARGLHGAKLIAFGKHPIAIRGRTTAGVRKRDQSCARPLTRHETSKHIFFWMRLLAGPPIRSLLASSVLALPGRSAKNAASCESRGRASSIAAEMSKRYESINPTLGIIMIPVLVVYI